jgi:hypothetical protein
MTLQSDDICCYGSKIEDFEGYTPIKVWNLLQFYRLSGKKTTLAKENLEPLVVKYAIFSPTDMRYYLKDFRGYSVDELYWYRQTLTFSGESLEIENLRRYAYDTNVVLLFTPEQMEETKLFLQKLWKSHFNSEGTVKYKDYINLLDQTLKFDDYKDYSKSLTGYATVCHQFELRITAIWDEIYKSKPPPE